MTTSPNSSFLARLSVGQKLATIPALFIAAIAAILLYTYLTSEDLKRDAFKVNITSRQRMLVQRQLSQVLLVALGVEAPSEASSSGTDAFLKITENADYLATRRLLNESAKALLDGGQVFVLESAKHEELTPPYDLATRDKIKDHQEALSAFAATADEFLKLKDTDPDYAAKRAELLQKCDEAEDSARAVTFQVAENSQTKIATMILWQTVIGIAVALLASLFSWIVMRGIVVPLGSAVSLAQQISAGNLKGSKLESKSDDEIGRLTLSFNQMLDSLKELTGQTISVTSNLNAASAEILASTQQQAAGTKEQAATIQQITTTMEEVRQSGAQISDRAKQVAAAAEATSATTAAGLSAVQETTRTMLAVRAQVEEVAEKVVALSEKTQAVGEIIATVNDIAERSNLLALNAAIEAAGAGEQGSRFSVVAGEIKNLADQAKESTVQVRTILGDIQKGINSSVMLTEEAVKRADTGKQQADVTEETIRRMADTTQESVQAFQQIIGATSQQQIGFEQVTQGMQDIRQAASQTAAGTVQLEKAVSSLNAQSHQLREAVGRYQL